jgi:hypothetical protein
MTPHPATLAYESPQTVINSFPTIPRHESLTYDYDVVNDRGEESCPGRQVIYPIGGFERYRDVTPNIN